MIGKRLQRIDVHDKVTGKERYADDVYIPGILTGYAVHSPTPHGYLHSVDVQAARELPGVHAVLTAADIPGGNKMAPYFIDDQVFLATEKVRSLGDVVCIIAAEDEATARRAAEFIHMDIENLPVIDSIQAAMQPDAVKIHPDGNIVNHVKIRHGDIEAGFAKADAIVEGTYTTPAIEHSYLEPDAVVSNLDPDGIIVVNVGTQGLYEELNNIAFGLGLPHDRVRVIQTPMGGGFGGKEETRIGFFSALLTYHTGKPVKMVWSREQAFLLSNKRHASSIYMKTGATRDGYLTALKAELLDDTGAYVQFGHLIVKFSSCMASGPYEVPNAWVDGMAVYTNKLRAGSMRGWGIPQVTFAIESQMDRLAVEIGMHPLIFRWKNAASEGSTAITGEALPRE